MQWTSPRSPSPASRVARADAMPLPERVDWAELGDEFIAAWGYPRGTFMPEHLQLLGPNGSGKSYFLAVVVDRRAALRGSHVIYVATKPADDTITALGWPTVDRWPPGSGYNRDKYRRVVFWAKARGLGDAAQAAQAAQIRELLEQLWKPRSNVIVVFDEIAYLEHELGLKRILTRYYREGRGLGITIAAGTQRTQGINRYFNSESKWQAVFPFADEDDRERVAQVLGNKLYFRRVLEDLDPGKREFLLRHTLTGQCYITHVTDVLPVTIHAAQERPPRVVHT